MEGAAMPQDTRRAYEQAIAALEPSLRRAFLQAVADLRSVSQINAIEEAVAIGDWRAVVDLIRMDERVFDRLDRAMETAFYEGGVYQLSHLSPPRLPSGRGASLTVRFQGRTPRAEAWARDVSGQLITEIIADQRDLVREAVEQGIANGRSPRTTALDLAGRVVNGSRTGGLIGLHSRQAQTVRALREELADPSTAGAYFDRALRDKRFDGLVRRSIASGERISRADIERIAGRYSDRALKHRADVIARTETIAAFNAGRYEAMQQLIDRGEVPASAVTITWSATMDGRTRDSHQLLNGTTVPFGEAFTSPNTGARLRFPGDTQLGAGGADTIACRCYSAPTVDWLSLAV